jgi:hypothetical protein
MTFSFSEVEEQNAVGFRFGQTKRGLGRRASQTKIPMHFIVRSKHETPDTR